MTSTEEPELDFTPFKGMLVNYPADVLVILDCCFAGNAVKSSHRSKNELLAACSVDAETGVKTKSFMRALITKLEYLSPNPFTVAMLHAELASNFQLEAQPFHSLLGSRNHTSIEIAKLKGLGTHAIVEPSGNTASRVWAEIKLPPQSKELNVEAWLHWLKSNTPLNIE
jgi:hypothetical protein